MLPIERSDELAAVNVFRCKNGNLDTPAADDSDGANRIYARPHNAFLSARNISNFAASDTAFPFGK